MIFSSKNNIFDGKNFIPEWQLDTENYTVTHNTEGKAPEEIYFHQEAVQYHVNYTVEHYPERFQKLVDSGEIISYLGELYDRVFDAVDELTEQMSENDREYRLAREKGDIITQAGIMNMYEMTAREIIYPAMVYI